jgi:hypothetical protein
MKIKKTLLNLAKAEETVGYLGETKLVRRYDGKHVLVGGSEAERAKARNWCRHFAPKIKFSISRTELSFVRN